MVAGCDQLGRRHAGLLRCAGAEVARSACRACGAEFPALPSYCSEEELLECRPCRGLAVAQPPAPAALLAVVMCSTCAWHFPTLSGYTPASEALRCRECLASEEYAP
jgi:hypothetical protein